MRKFSFFILAGILLNFAGLAQVTVTNPTNTTPALAATYTSLANAITALNSITAISGPVVITLTAGNPETAPPGGYAIQFFATTSAINNITIAGNNNLITAFTPQPVGNLNDAVFKLIGVDHVQLQDFMMLENASNVNSTPGTNDMTEFGVALLRAGTTDGAQNNTILNNTIALNKIYTNSFGLYSSVRHSSTDITPDDITSISGSNSGNRIYGNLISNVNYGVVFMGSITPAFMDNGNDIGGSSAATGNTCTNWGTGVAGSSYPDITGSNYCIYMVHGINENISYNTISSAVHTDNNPLGGILKNFTIAQPTGVIIATYNNNIISLAKSSTSGAVTGISIEGMSPALSTAAININNNLISSIDVSGSGSSSSITGISNSSACGVLNINNNTVRGCTSTGSTAGAHFTGITNTGAVVNNININDNKLGDAIAGAISYSVFTNAPVYGINNTQHPVTCTVSIINNDIRGIVHSLGSASGQIYIANRAVGQVGNQVINGNTFTNLSVNTSSAIAFIARQGHMTATGSAQCRNNSIVGSFTNNNAGATPSTMFFYFVESFPSQSVNGSVVTVTGNNFSNVTVNGLVSIQGYYDLEGLSSSNAPAKTYTGNVMNNITMGTGSIFAMYISNGGGVVCSTNVVSNISTGGFIAGIWFSSTNGQGPDHLSNNTVSNLASGNANVVGIMAGSLAVPNLSISGNVVSGLSSTGTTNVQMVGIEIIQGQSTHVSNNLINNIQGSGTGASTFAYGIRVNTGTNVQVYQNRIYDVRHVGFTTAPAPSVNGIHSLNPANLTVYNNFIADLKAPNAAQADAIRGININALGANTTYRLYYNSVYINAVSTGTNFGTSGIFHTGNATATTGRLEMINNIIVNTSTANGTGFTAAFRRSNTTLTNYAAASDHNLYYAGTPSANRLIFYDGTNSDQTLASYQARVSSRDANSISTMPYFISPTDLHLITDANCAIEDAGNNTGILIPTDIDGDTRDIFPTDIGADEFDGNFVLSLVVPPAVCFPNTVDLTAAVGAGSTSSSPGAPAAISYWEDAAATIPIQPIHGTPTAITTSGTYYIKLEKGSCNAIGSVPVTINGTGGTLAGIMGGSIVCLNAPVGTGTYYVDGSCNLIARVVPSGGSPVAGMINACVIVDGTQQYFNGEPYVQRHFDIEPATNAATATATIDLYYTNDEFVAYNTNNTAWPRLPTVAGGANGDPNVANIRITQFHGTPTGGLPTTTPGNYTGTRVLINPGAANVFWNGFFWRVTFDVNGFSGFYLHTTLTNTPLPITVNYLNGRRQGSSHVLDWKVTCVSTPSATITLERSGDARNFTGMYTITADAARCNAPFDHTDANPLNGMNYYRLKIADADGKITYSSTVALLHAVKGFDIISIAPNPVVHDNFKLNVASAQTGKMEVTILDMQGRLVSRQSSSLIAGFNIVPVNVAALPPGTYTIKSSIADHQTKVMLFVKQ